MKDEDRKSYAELEKRLLSKFGAKKITPQEAVEYIPIRYGGSKQMREHDDQFAFATDDWFCGSDEIFLLPSKGEKSHQGVCQKLGCVLAIRVADGFVRFFKTYGDDGCYHTSSELYKELKSFQKNH